jgi:hypothetical protein
MRNQIGVVKLSKKHVNSREFVENYIREFKKLNGRENERTCEKKGPETRASFFLTWQPSFRENTFYFCRKTLACSMIFCFSSLPLVVSGTEEERETRDPSLPPSLGLSYPCTTRSTVQLTVRDVSPTCEQQQRLEDPTMCPGCSSPIIVHV